MFQKRNGEGILNLKFGIYAKLGLPERPSIADYFEPEGDDCKAATTFAEIGPGGGQRKCKLSEFAAMHYI